MADSFTPNLNLRKPEVGAAADTWGGIAGLNGDLDLLDAIFLATGLGTAVGLHVGNDKVLNVEGGFTLKDPVDITKVAVFDRSLITTATTRTYSFPDASGTLSLGGASAEAVLATATVGLSTSYVAKLTLPSVGAAGQKWCVSAYATGRNPSLPDFIYAQIFDGTAAIAATNGVSSTNAGIGGFNWTVNLALSRIVTLAGPTVFSLRGKADGSGSQFLGGAASSDSFTAIQAVRLS